MQLLEVILVSGNTRMINATPPRPHFISNSIISVITSIWTDNGLYRIALIIKYIKT